VRSLQGRLIETMHGQNWRVHEWMEVGPSPVTPTPAAVARRIGAIFGTLHSLAIPHEAPMGEHLTLRRPDAEWEQLLDRARAAHKPWAEQLDETLPMLFDLRTIEADIGSNEFILCNRVLNPEHVRIGHNDELVVTKWKLRRVTHTRVRTRLGTHTVDAGTIDQRKAIAAFRDGYVHAADRWPKLDLASFTTAVS